MIDAATLIGYYPRLLACALHKGWSVADAEELAWDTITLAWEWSLDRSVRNWTGGWLFTVLHNEMVNRVRDRESAKLVPLPAPETVADKESCEPGPQRWWRDATLTALRKRGRVKVADHVQAYLDGHSKDDHKFRRQLQEVRKWAAKGNQNACDGIPLVLSRFKETLTQHQHVEILTLGRPFQWVGHTEDLERFYAKQYGTTRRCAWHFRFACSYTDSLVNSANENGDSLIKVTYVTDADSYWKECSNSTKDLNRRAARDWQFTLKNGPGGLDYLDAVGYDTISICYAGLGEAKTPLFIARRDMLHRFDTVTPDEGREYVEALPAICEKSEVRLK